MMENRELKTAMLLLETIVAMGNITVLLLHQFFFFYCRHFIFSVAYLRVLSHETDLRLGGAYANVPETEFFLRARLTHIPLMGIEMLGVTVL